MANENKFRRLQCEQACKKLIEEQGGGGAGIDIYVIDQGETFEQSGVSFPCIVCYKIDEEIYQANVLTEQSGTIFDEQTTVESVYSFTNFVYDSQAKTLKADLYIHETA